LGNRCNTKGFTLIELLVVVTLLTAMVSWGIPKLGSSFNESALDAASMDVETAILYAQKRAIASGQTCRLTVDVANEVVGVEIVTITTSLLGVQTELTEADVETTSFEKVKHPLRPFDDYEIDMVAESRFHEVVIDSMTYDSGSELDFDALGRPSTGATLVLSRAGQQKTIQVDGQTGGVTIN